MRHFLFFTLLFFSSSVFAGEISGRVFMEKTGKAVGKIPMRLHVYKDEYEFSGSEVLTDASGNYRFRELQTDERYGYILYPIYEGVNYPYQEVVFPKGTSVVKKEFPINESTGSTENISVDESIFFEFGKKDIWKVTHEITLENKGDLLYHSSRGDAEPLLFSLFEGGFDLSYLEGITRNNTKIDDQKDTLQAFLTVPEHETLKIRFSYYYLPEARHVNFDRVAFLNRSNVTLFFKNNIRIVSNQFQSDPMMLQGHEDFTRAFTSGVIKQNDKINFEIKGFFLQRDLLHMLVISGCLAFIIFMLIWVIKQKRVSKKHGKELTERMHRYLIELRKQHKEGTLNDHQFRKEDQRVRNFLFQMSKIKNDRD